MSRESRRMPRRVVTTLIEVVDTMTEQSIGTMSNLSVGGMLLMARARLVEDALYQFRFNLPESGSQFIEVGAHVLWLDDASTSGRSWVGLRFLGLAPETTLQLRNWISQDAQAS